MRHLKSKNRLGRYTSWRKATVRDIAKAVLVRQRICTTSAKAKEARKLVDRLITLGKKGTLAHRRRAFKVLCDHRLVSDLFKKIAPRFNRRVGGYTRLIPVSNRRGDNARLSFLELTEKEEVVVTKARSSATAKAKKVDVPASSSDKDVPAAPETKDQALKKDVSHHTDKGKAPKGDMAPKPKIGGIRKIFRRKTGE